MSSSTRTLKIFDYLKQNKKNIEKKNKNQREAVEEKKSREQGKKKNLLGGGCRQSLRRGKEKGRGSS